MTRLLDDGLNVMTGATAPARDREPSPSEPPAIADLTIEEVLDKVDAGVFTAAEALAEERAGKNRVGLTEPLSRELARGRGDGSAD